VDKGEDESEGKDMKNEAKSVKSACKVNIKIFSFFIFVFALAFSFFYLLPALAPSTAADGDGINVTEEWNKTFGGTGIDKSYSVQQTLDGGYIVAGETYSYGAGDFDIWLIKTDSNGNEQWNRTFGGAKADRLDRGGSVRQTADSGYIITGYTKSYGVGDADAWLIKTDANGIEQWNKTFSGASMDWGHSVQQTEDGGYIIAGRTDPYVGARADAWLIKTDANGTEQWNRTFGSDGCEYAASVQQTSDGGYILTGRTNSYSVGEADAWLIKTDLEGNEEWNRTFVGIYYDYGYSVQQTSDGGYVIAGSTNGRNDVWLIKTDSSGTEEWNSIFGGTSKDEGYSVNQTTDGGYVVAGYTASYGTAGSADVWLIKTDSDGNEQWNVTLGEAGDDRSYSVQQTADGGYIMAGFTNSLGAGGYDVWVIKISQPGPEEIDILPIAIETPATVYANLSNTISTSIKNNGTAPAGSFNISLSADGSSVDRVRVYGLDAGEGTNVSFEWTPFLAGNYNLTVIADSDDEIVETNETNNELKGEDVFALPTDVRRLTFNPNSSINPDVAADSDGNIHVVWSDDRGGWDGSYELYYKKLAPNGMVLVNDTRLTQLAGSYGSSINPAIAIDSNDNVQVVWDYKLRYYPYENYWISTYYLKLDNDGNMLIKPKVIRESPDYYSHYFLRGIALDHSGNIHVAVFYDFDVSQGKCSDDGIIYIKLDNEGTELVNYTIDSVPKKPNYGRWDCIDMPSSIAVDSEGCAYMAYNKGLGACAGSPCSGFACHCPACAKAYYVKIDEGGGVHNQNLTGDLPLPSLYPSVCVDANSDNKYVIWSQHNRSGTVICDEWNHCYTELYGFDFYYTKFDKSDNKVIDSKRITYEDYLVESGWWGVVRGVRCSIIDTELGIIHLAWSVPKPKAGENRNIWYMAFDACGDNITNETLVSLEGGDSWEPSEDACKEGAHLVWTDNRDGNDEIYYAKIELPENIVSLICPTGTWTAQNENAAYSIGILSTMPDRESFDLTIANLDGADVAELSRNTITLEPYTPDEVTMNVTDADIGKYRVKIRAESQTNPGINAECMITTSVEVPKPDLTVSAVDAYHNNTVESPWFNLPNEVDIIVKNIGTANASSFYLCLYAGSELVGKQVVPGLARDNSTTVQFKWTPVGEDCFKDCTFSESSEDYTLKAVADCDYNVTESDEGNNELTTVETACYNGYMADEPLENVAHGKLRGGLIFTTGDGSYGCVNSPGATKEAQYEITLPEGVAVKLAQLNVYYTWCKPEHVCPEMEVGITNETGTYVVPLEKRYNDIKCRGPDASWVYTWGDYIYNLTDYIRGSGTYTVTVKNVGSDYHSFCLAAPGIVLLYEDENARLIEYWLNEGADVLLGGRRSDGGSLALEECITPAMFTGSIETGNVVNATLGVVSVWAGSSWQPGQTNYLFFNGVVLGQGVYHGNDEKYEGTIDSITMHIGSTNAQVGVNVSDITEYLNDNDNVAGQGDDGDCMIPTNAFLVVEYSELEVNKTVWDAERGTWVEKTTAKLNDTLRFRCVIQNVGQYSMMNITAVDILPECLEYKGNATVAGTPREPDWIAGNQFGWNFTGPLAPSETLTIEFNATVVDPVAGTNTLKASAWCSETEEWFSVEDNVRVFVLEPLSSPFFIYGWVNRSDGSLVNNPDVAITNLNTSEVFDAETKANSNYYQIMTSLEKMSADDMLRFTASDQGNSTEFNHTLTQEEINFGGLFNFNITLKHGPPPAVFDTGEGTYPSISGTLRGIIKPNRKIEVNRMYTYACAGTGGHSEYVEICNGTFYINATWNGYTGDYHNITFPYQFTLLANHTYNYTIKTGSYPQIRHTHELTTNNGTITCTEFIDANGKRYNNWIPAIKLFREI